MIGISHWGMFDARKIPFKFFPLTWGHDMDEEFYYGDRILDWEFYS